MLKSFIYAIFGIEVRFESSGYDFFRQFWFLLEVFATDRHTNRPETKSRPAGGFPGGGSLCTPHGRPVPGLDAVGCEGRKSKKCAMRCGKLMVIVNTG